MATKLMMILVCVVFSATMMMGATKVEAQIPPNIAPVPARISPNIAPAPARLSPNIAPAPVRISPNIAPAPARISPNIAPARARISPNIAPAPAGISPNIAPAPGNLPVVVNMIGVVYCTINGTIGSNGISTPAFRNAMVQLRCGDQVIAMGRTNNLGFFSILANDVPFPLASISSNCRVVVATPLATCNSFLPSSRLLVSTGLQQLTNPLGGLIGNIMGSSINSANSIVFIPLGFLLFGSTGA